jgi:hypothetical protein
MAILYLKFGIALPCIINEITGFYCPGCGITRMCLSLLKGEIYQAFRYNPIIFIDVPIIIISLFLEKCFKNVKNINKITNVIFIILLIITIIFGVLRNIPQLSFLAPTEI